MKLYVISLVLLTFTICTPINVMAEEPHPASDEAERGTEPIGSQGDEELQDQDEDFDDLDEEVPTISDPIEPFNRAMFHFNDRLYFWVLKPVALGYNFVVPEKARIGVRRFFSNITTPVRFVNSVLQFKFEHAGVELSRFAINTTIGVAGFMDPAKEKWKLLKHKEDLGQTLGFYGSGPGFYINWPFLGPSSVRDTIGLVGDFFLDPTSYLFPHDRVGVAGVNAYRRVNETSLNIGVYEDIKKELEPYIFLRNGYHQHRESMIKE